MLSCTVSSPLSRCTSSDRFKALNSLPVIRYDEACSQPNPDFSVKLGDKACSRKADAFGL